MPELPLTDMHLRHRGLTLAVASCYVEAARVCLDRHHVSPQTAKIRDEPTEAEAELIWVATDALTRGAWANDTDATEAGAYALVIASAELTKGLVAVRRCETATGADYYLGPPGSGVEDLEDCLRLEVSGTDSDDDRELTRRLTAKVAQARRGSSSLPALAGVVGYPQCMILFRRVA